MSVREAPARARATQSGVLGGVTSGRAGRGGARRAGARPARGSWRARRGAWRWSPALWLLAAQLCALGGLHVLLRESAWWFVVAGYALLVLVVATLTRLLVPVPLLAPVLAAAAGLGGLTVGFAADTAVGGLVPTGETWDRMREIVDSGLRSIATQTSPAAPEFGLVFLVAIGACATTILAESLAVGMRLPALGALPVLALLVIPVVIQPGSSDGLLALLTAAALLGLIRVPHPPTSRALALGLAMLTLVGAVVGGALIPQSDEAGRIGTASSANPIIALGADLRRGDPLPAVAYTTTSGEPVYLRLASLDTFTGSSWTPALAGYQDGPLSRLSAPVGLSGAVDTTAQRIRVHVGQISGRWLPVPYPTTAIAGAGDGWRWGPGDLSIVSRDNDIRDREYTADYLELAPTAEQLRAATVPSGDEAEAAGLSAQLALPDDVPAVIAETAQRVAGGESTPYEQALALQNWLRGPDFTYSIDAPVEQGYDGTGLEVIARFLEVRSGYCVHFASTMAVMARELGIPSRVVVGFQPGTPRPDLGEGAFLATTDDLHAWPELYLEGVGWTRFEPTPGRGELPPDPPLSTDVTAPQVPADDLGPDAAQPPAPVDPAPVRDPSDVDPGTPSAADAAADDGLDAARSGTLRTLALVLGTVLVLAAVTPFAARRVLRARRLRRAARGPGAAAAAWTELRATVVDAGEDAPDTETPRAFADRLAEERGERDPRVDALVVAVESLAYRPPGSLGLDPALVRAALAALEARLPPLARVRAAVLPASLLGSIGFGAPEFGAPGSGATGVGASPTTNAEPWSVATHAPATEGP
ncbi:MAG: transglutaminase domain-containing protein [Actinomycetales bacterium]|nr:transglutaminase domain-containing protein [Actinomycetales bacterium]